MRGNNLFSNFVEKEKVMKNLRQLLLAALFLAPLALFSQEESDAPVVKKLAFLRGFQSEAGVNCTSFLRKIIDRDSAGIDNSYPYVVGYTLYYRNIGLRAAAGWTSLENLNEGGSNNNAPVINGESQKDFRLGLEYELKLSRHWRASAGADGVYGWGDRSITTFFTDAFGNKQSGRIGEDLTRWGGGGFVGIKYFFNDRCGLRTEATGYWLRKKTEYHNDFYLPFAERTDETVQSMNIEPPAALFFFFRF